MKWTEDTIWLVLLIIILIGIPLYTILKHWPNIKGDCDHRFEIGSVINTKKEPRCYYCGKTLKEIKDGKEE